MVFIALIVGILTYVRARIQEHRLWEAGVKAAAKVAIPERIASDAV